MKNFMKTLDFVSFLNESKKEEKIEILILSGEERPTVESFMKECKKKKIVCNSVNVKKIKLEKVYNGHVIRTIGEDEKEGKKILIRPENTVIIPRRGVISNTHTKGILRELENSRYFCINSLKSIELCESKYLTSEVLEANNLPVPRYSLISQEEDLDEALKAVGGKFPVILKLLEGTQGIGVSIVDSYSSLKSVYQTIAKVAPGNEILIQEKIDSNYDIRVQVITKNLDGKNTDKDNFIILGAMKRKAVKKDFRTNYSLGGSVSEIKLTKEIQDIACKSAFAVGCHWCGVDIMVDSKTGKPYILEVNSSPGTEGISQAIGKPIVDEVIDYVEDKNNWDYSNLEIGYLESIEIPGIGKMVAKFDTGNGSTSCTIHADEAKEERGYLIWNVGKHKFKHKIIDRSQSEIGDEILERPVIEMDIIFNGSKVENVRISPSSREEKSTPFLANRKLMNQLGVTVNPERVFVITDEIKGYVPMDAKKEIHGGIEFLPTKESNSVKPDVLKYSEFINESEIPKGKILFISFTDKTRGVSYHDYLKSKLNCTFCLWQDLIFQDDEILLDGKKVKDFDFVFIGVISKNPNYFVALEKYVTKYKIPYFKYGCSPERNNKMYQNTAMSIEGVPQIPTIISKCSSVDSKDLINKLGLPIVSKIINGSKGKGVELKSTKKELEDFLKAHEDETMIFQKFIENEGDYRVFLIGQKIIYTIKRKTKDKKKEFRNNYSLGGTVEKIDLDKVPSEIAKKASKIMNFDVSGVDLIKDEKTGKWYVMEVNSAPQFGTKNDNKIVIDYRDILDKFIKIIKNNI